MKPADAECRARAATAAAAKDQDQRSRRPVITALSQDPPAAMIALGPGVEVAEEVHDADELLLLVSGSVDVIAGGGTRRLDHPFPSANIAAGHPHSLRAGADGAVLVAVMLPAAKDQDQRAAHLDGDPFTSAPWSKARARFVEAVDEVTIWARDRAIQSPNTPGREAAERRLVDACAAACLAVGWPDGTRAGWAIASTDALRKIKALREEGDGLRIRLAAAETATEQARRERDAAEKDRGMLRSQIDRLVRESIAWAEATGESAPHEAGKAMAALRSRVADLEAESEAWREVTGHNSPRALELAQTDPGRTWVERAEARLTEAERKIEALLSNLAPWTSAINTPRILGADFDGLRARIDAVKRRLASKPDTLSEECQRIAAEVEEERRKLRACAPASAPPADPGAAGREGATTFLPASASRQEREAARLQIALDIAARADRGTLSRMPEQTGIIEPPVPHVTAEQMQAAIVKMLREQAELAGKYSAADAADAIERCEHLSFIEPPVPHRAGA